MTVANQLVGLRCESKQIRGCRQDSHTESRPPVDVSARLPRRSDGRRPIQRRESLYHTTNRAVTIAKLNSDGQ